MRNKGGYMDKTFSKMVEEDIKYFKALFEEPPNIDSKICLFVSKLNK